MRNIFTSPISLMEIQPKHAVCRLPFHAPTPCPPATRTLVGRDVLGAPRPRRRHRKRQRVRGPPKTSAPTATHNIHTHPGRARRPRRAAHTKTTSETPTGTRAAGDVGPYHTPRNIHTHPGRARRPRRAAHTKTTSKTPTGTRAAEDVGPYHATHNIHTRTPW